MEFAAACRGAQGIKMYFVKIDITICIERRLERSKLKTHFANPNLSRRVPLPLLGNHPEAFVEEALVGDTGVECLLQRLVALLHLLSMLKELC